MKRIKDTFIQYCYRQRQQAGIPLVSKGGWLCHCLRTIGRGLQCQWINS